MPFISSQPPSAPARPEQKGRALLRLQAVFGFCVVMGLAFIALLIAAVVLSFFGACASVVLIPRL